MRRVVPGSLLASALLWGCGGESDPEIDGRQPTATDPAEAADDSANDAGSDDDADVRSENETAGTGGAPVESNSAGARGIGGAPIDIGAFGGSTGGEPDEGSSNSGGPSGSLEPECEGGEVTPLDWSACFWSGSVPFDVSAEGRLAGTITEVGSDVALSCFSREDASIVVGGADCDNWNYECSSAPSEGITSVTVGEGDSAFHLAWYVGELDEVALGDELEVRYVRDIINDIGGYDHRQLSVLHGQRALFHIVQGPMDSALLDDWVGLEARYGETACHTTGDFCDLRLTDVLFSSRDESTTLAIGETGFVQGLDVTFVAGPQLGDRGACDGTTHHTFAFVPVQVAR